MSNFEARIRRWFWLMWPPRIFQGWCGYDVYDWKRRTILIGAIKANTLPRKDDPSTLKIFWSDPLSIVAHPTFWP